MGKPRFGIAVALLLVAGTASAQSGLNSASLPNRTQSNPTPPMRLPSASLPDRTPEQPIPPERRDQFLANRFTYANPPFRFRHRFATPYYSYGYGYPAYVTGSSEPPAPMATAPNGYLDLQTQPGAAQVYIDGYYMGSVNDFRRIIPGHSLEAGAHRVELRAPGYETQAFDVMIAPNKTVTYRGDLEAKASAAVAPLGAPRAAAKTFYVIPGCYAGDRPPKDVRLPRGCDRSRVRAIPPTIMSVR